MTTQTIDRPTSAARRPQWVRSCRWMLSRTMYLMLSGWALLIVVVGTILAIVGSNVHVNMSGIAFGHQALIWYPFTIALIFAVTYLPLQVANGMTRRSFIEAAIVTNIVVGIANAVFMTVALVVERLIYDRLGWNQGTTDGKGNDLLAAGIGVYGIDLVVMFIGATVSGTLVGVTYYRFKLLATLMLPLTVFPVVGIALFVLSEPTRWTPWDIGLFSSWVARALVGALILVAACVALVLVTRRVAIDTRKT